MFKLIATVFSTMLLISCSENNLNNPTKPNPIDAPKDSIAIVSNPEVKPAVVSSGFFPIDTSGILLFPLSFSHAEKKSTNSVEYSTRSDAADYWNIIFLNTKTNQSHILSEQKMLITNFHSNYNSSDNNSALNGKYIYYNIITNDYNKDQILDKKDPSYLFISDKKGNNLQQVSPDNHHLLNWQFITSSNKIMMITLKDSDQNKQFDDKDETVIYEFEPGKSSVANQTFTADFNNKLKWLYHKHWQQGNK